MHDAFEHGELDAFGGHAWRADDDHDHATPVKPYAHGAFAGESV